MEEKELREYLQIFNEKSQSILGFALELGKEIGRGGMGSVHEVHKRGGRLRRAVAGALGLSDEPMVMKFLRSDIRYGAQNKYDTIPLDERKQYEEFFDNEIRIMQKLHHHRNIMPLKHSITHQVSAKNGKPGYKVYMLLMPRLRSVESCLGTCVSEAQLLDLAKDIAHALRECHRNGILHRDVKPDNIFVSDEKDFILGDFGIIRDFRFKQGSLVTGIGTPNFIAPEIVGGTAKKDHYAPDVFSLGATMYYLATGDTVAEPNGLSGVNYKPRAHLEQKLGKTKLSRGLREIILKALAHDWWDRYADGEELYNALCDYTNPVHRQTGTGPMRGTGPMQGNVLSQARQKLIEGDYKAAMGLLSPHKDKKQVYKILLLYATCCYLYNVPNRDSRYEKQMDQMIDQTGEIAYQGSLAAGYLCAGLCFRKGDMEAFQQLIEGSAEDRFVPGMYMCGLSMMNGLFGNDPQTMQKGRDLVFEAAQKDYREAIVQVAQMQKSKSVYIPLQTFPKLQREIEKLEAAEQKDPEAYRKDNARNAVEDLLKYLCKE